MLRREFRPQCAAAPDGPHTTRLLVAVFKLYGMDAKGDQEIWHRPVTDRRFPVEPKSKSRHTANGILKQAGLPKAV